MGKKFNAEEMETAIRANWDQFRSRMHDEWREFKDEELAEAKENLHSFIVQVERRTHESAEYVREKLIQWKGEIQARQASPPRKPS